MLMCKPPFGCGIVRTCMDIDDLVNPSDIFGKTPDPQKERSGWHELFSTLGILLTALLVALFIIAFVFRSYQVDGPSMENTLHNTDKLIIWKVPRSWASLTGNPYIPKRGDVIVFTQDGLS